MTYVISFKNKFYFYNYRPKIFICQQKSDKLNGLKNFLTEFSVINERQIEEITMWDYYVIYAIIFDLKGKLDREVKALYNIFTENN